MFLCGLLGYSKQAFYKQINAQESMHMEEQVVLDLIHTKRKLWKRGSGRNLYTLIKPELNRHNIKMGRDKLFTFLKDHDLQMKSKKKVVKTTNSYHFYHRYPNLIKELTPIRANGVWVSDITYVWIRDLDNYAYLFLITDLYSRKVMGYNLSHSLKAEGAIKALKMAIRNAGKANLDGCIHHSDRGIQYCCYDYTALLKKTGISISMTENSDPLENAVAERINRTIKDEFTHEKQMSFESLDKAKSSIKSIIDFYNNIRPHSSIERYTPAKAYGMYGKLNRMWKNYYKVKTNADLQYVGDFFRHNCS